MGEVTLGFSEDFRIRDLTTVENSIRVYYRSNLQVSDSSVVPELQDYWVKEFSKSNMIISLNLTNPLYVSVG